jgi:hypothetical protein
MTQIPLSPPARRQPNSVQVGLGFCFDISKDPIKVEYLEAFYIHFQICDQGFLHKMETASTTCKDSILHFQLSTAQRDCSNGSVTRLRT